MHNNFFRNGGQATSPILDTYCGRNQTIGEIFSHSHQIVVEFKSDSSYEYSGFELFWEEGGIGTD